MDWSTRVVLAGVLALSSCRARNAPAASERAASPTPASASPKAPGVAIQGPPQALRARLSSIYALRLDRRFVAAFDELEVLARGKPCAEPAAAPALAAGRWTVTACGEAVGTLSADPDVPEVLALLEARARKLVPRAAVPAAHVESPLLSADEALARVARLERADAPLPPADLHALSAGLAALNFALPDELEVADGLRARGLAAVALDRALGQEDTAREEGLLEMSLGYEAAARAAAARLRPGDPVRAYLGRDDETLARLAGAGSGAAVQLLWLRRQVEIGSDDASAYAARVPRAPLGVGLERLRMSGFVARGTAGPIVARQVLTPRGPGSARRIGPRKALLAQLTELLATATPSEQRFLRAAFFDAVARASDFALETRSVADEGERILRSLGRGGPGTAEEGLTRWLALRVDVERSERRAADIVEAIGALPGLGGGPRVSLLVLLGRQLEYGDPAWTAAMRKLPAVLDGRPRHRCEVAGLAAGGIPDPRLREESLRSAARLGGDTWSRGSVAKLDGDVAALRSLAGDARLSDSWRAWAIGLIDREGGEDAEVERLYRALLSPARDDFAVRFALVAFLEHRRRWADVEALVTEWLRRGHQERDLRGPAARATLARALSRQGRDEAALAILDPALDSWKADVLTRVGVAAARLHREQAARAIVAAIAARYPSAEGRRSRAEVLWALGDADGAAAVLAEAAPQPIFDWARRYADAFADAFEDDPAAAATAFAALQRKGIDPIALTQVPGELHARHRDDLAATLATSLRMDNPVGDLELATEAYGYLDAAQGREKARAWLERRVPTSLRGPLSMFAFAQRRPELFWDLVPAPAGQGERDDFVWLMFAATSLRAPTTAAHASALAARFAPVRSGFYHHLGRFLLGYEGQEAAVQAVASGKRACEASFYVGFAAEARGDLATAADWYRAAVENGTPTDGEYRWATDQLTRWSGAERSLARLAKEGKGGGRTERPAPR